MIFRKLLHYEIAYSGGFECLDIFVPVACFCPYREKQGFFRVQQFATVGKQERDLCFRFVYYRPATGNACYFFDSVFHFSLNSGAMSSSNSNPVNFFNFANKYHNATHITMVEGRAITG